MRGAKDYENKPNSSRFARVVDIAKRLRAGVKIGGS